MENENILIIKDLDVRLFTDRGELPVIDRLSLTRKPLASWVRVAAERVCWLLPSWDWWLIRER